MRKALVVGIDYHDYLQPLFGCVRDARAVAQIMSRHADGRVNFANPKELSASSVTDKVTREELKQAIRELFEGNSEIALFYFAGHGHIEETGGFLCASDSKTGDDGVALTDVMAFARRSSAANKIIILDSCNSGAAGSKAEASGIAEISEGMTILTAATADQYATEISEKGGVFTNLFLDALNGSAANLVGSVTPGSVYAHIDQSLGPWAQRPVFKTNVTKFVSLRETTPPIALKELQALSTYFPQPGFKFKLDPSFERERNSDQLSDPNFPSPDPKNTEVFNILQNYARVNLVRPVDAPHMWHAAMESKSCELTALGEHYRQLAQRELL